MSTQFPVAQHLLRWLVDPTASVQEYTGLRLKGMLVEYERGHPADVLFAYRSLRVYTASDAHFPPRPRFLEVYESHVLVFPPGIELFRQPNGPWYAEGSVQARGFSFSVWSTAPKGAVRAIAQHLYQALARQAG